jgi:exodeoxyribonuclease-3
MTLRVLSYNIRYGGTSRESELAAVIRSAAPDVVMLQEAIDPSVVMRLARLTEMPYWGARLGYSTGFLSRRAVEHHAWHHPIGSRHAFLELSLERVDCRLFGLHLSAWFSKWSERRRAREIRALLDGISHYQSGFHLIAGDFNALAPGETLQVRRMPRWIRAMVWLSGRDIARETIQAMLDAHYADTWRLKHDGNPGYTFPTWDPHVRLDYVFIPARDAARVERCEIVASPSEARAASDHFPLLADITSD